MPLALAIAACVFCAHAAAQTSSKESLQKLADTISQELDATEKSKAAETPKSFVNDQRAATGRMMLEQLRNALSRSDVASTELETALEQLPIYFPSDAIRKQCEQLAAQLRAEREAKEKAAVAEIEIALKKAADSVRAAKSASDLDGVVEKLDALKTSQGDPERSSPAMARVLQRVEPAKDFVTLWQTYLAQRDAGAGYEMQQTLSKLSDLTWADAIPRSEILKLSLHANRQETVPPIAIQNVNEEVNRIIAGIKSPAEISDAITALRQLIARRGPNGLTSPEQAISEMTEMERAYRAFSAGLPANVPMLARDSAAPYKDALLPVRAQLITMVLPRYLGLSETKPDDGEGPYDFLSRIVADAIKREDYLLAARALQTRQMLGEGTSYGGNESSQAGLFVVAHNQEVAGQFALAVASYEKALAISSDLIPPKAIGDRLAAIKADHPQEFQQGLEMYLAPPVPSYPPGYPASLAARRAAAFGQPAPGGPPPVLAVPAASPSASPTASARPSASPFASPSSTMAVSPAP